MPPMTNFLGNSVLTNYLIAAGKWFALHTSDPGPSGSSATEMTGGGYQRAQLTWSVPANRSVANTNAFKILNLPAATVTHMGVWDDQYAGNLLYTIPLGTPLVVTAGQFFLLPIGDLAIVLS